MNRQVDRLGAAPSLTSTFWQAKPKSVPTCSRNRTAASREEWGCLELHWDFPPLSLHPPGDLRPPWGSKAKEKGDQRGQVMEVLGTKGDQE